MWRGFKVVHMLERERTEAALKRRGLPIRKRFAIGFTQIALLLLLILVLGIITLMEAVAVAIASLMWFYTTCSKLGSWRSKSAGPLMRGGNCAVCTSPSSLGLCQNEHCCLLSSAEATTLLSESRKK